MDTLIHTKLGPFQLVELVRRGGMAAVYKAYQPSLGRYVAVKVLQHHHDRQFAQRFKAEARIVAQLHHPNILQIYEYGEQDGILYLATQYVADGASLADVAKPMPLEAALELTQRLLAALEHAHAQGIVHRDVKPSNVLLPTPDWPLLADFGIAKLLEGADPDLTSAGQVIGTAAYMAPEQAAGELVDARTDLYTVGVLLYELLTGQVPFGASPRSAVLARQTSEPPPAPRRINPKVPAAAELLVLRALAKRPDERYQSAGDMAADLKRLNAQAGPAAVSETEAGTEIVPPPSSAGGLGWVPAALVLAVLGVFGAAGLLARREAPAAEPPLHASGKVVLSDKDLRNDRAYIAINGLPPPKPGQVYAAWLVGQTNNLALGPLQASDGDTLAVTYISPDKSNLLAYDRVYITSVPEAAAPTDLANVIMTSTPPTQALVYIRHLLLNVEDTPKQIGFALGLRQEASEISRRADMLAQAAEAGDLADVRRRAEQLINAIEGAQGAHYGDSDGNGQISNPGDGFGLLENGQQLGYIQGVADHAALAGAAPDASEEIKSYAAAIKTTGEVVRELVTEVRDHALNILEAPGVDQAEADVAAIRRLARRALLGADEGKAVEPDPEDGGVLRIYAVAQFMAEMPIAPGSVDLPPTQ